MMFVLLLEIVWHREEVTSSERILRVTGDKSSAPWEGFNSMLGFYIHNINIFLLQVKPRELLRLSQNISKRSLCVSQLFPSMQDILFMVLWGLIRSWLELWGYCRKLCVCVGSMSLFLYQELECLIPALRRWARATGECWIFSLKLEKCLCWFLLLCKTPSSHAGIPKSCSWELRCQQWASPQ